MLTKILNLLIKIIKKTISIIVFIIYHFFDSYRIFFLYLYRDGLWDLIKVLKLLFRFFRWLSKILFFFIVRRIVIFIVFLKDCCRVLPFFFKPRHVYIEYNMLLSSKARKKHRRRQSKFNHFFFFLLL